LWAMARQMGQLLARWSPSTAWSDPWLAMELGQRLAQAQPHHIQPKQKQPQWRQKQTYSC